MKHFKKLMRLSALVVFIFLASLGIGIGAPVIVTKSGKDENPIEVQANLPDPEKNKGGSEQFSIRQ